MEVLGLPNGTCDKAGHGAKLSVNGEAQCVKCVAEVERSKRTVIPVVTVNDPGEDAFAPNGMLRAGHKAEDKPVVINVPIAPGGPAPRVVHASQVVCPSLVGIRDAISHLPMPKNLKQYKRLQKIQSLINEALSEEENG